MIDAIATWAAAHGATFEAFAAMVATFNSDPDYWAGQPLTRLHATATGDAPRAAKPSPFRI